MSDIKQDHPEAPRRRRLLVAVDAAEGAERLLEAAAEMAARMRIDLLGLFVEDIDLLGLGDNPLIRTVSAFGGVSRAINRAVIEQALRRQVLETRLALERVAQTRNVRATFEVRRGRLASAFESAAANDIIVVRRAAENVQHIPASPRARINAATYKMVSAARHSLIVLDVRSDAAAGGFGNVVALFDGSAETVSALIAAADIVDRRRGDGITVVPIAETEADADRLGRQAQDILAPLGHQPRIAPHTSADLTALCATCATQGGVLVLHANHRLLQGEAMTRLLDTIECSVMVVR